LCIVKSFFGTGYAGLGSRCLPKFVCNALHQTINYLLTQTRPFRKDLVHHAFDDVAAQFVADPAVFEIGLEFPLQVVFGFRGRLLLGQPGLKALNRRTSSGGCVDNRRLGS
jgi:hypothetical protein